MEELPLSLVNQAIVDPARVNVQCQAQKLPSLIPEEVFKRIVIYLKPKDLAAWISTCRDAFRIVAMQTLEISSIAGVQICGIFCDGDDELKSRFSPWLLARALLLSCQNSKELDRPLHTMGPARNAEKKSVSEKRTGALTKIIITLSETSSRTYWLERIIQLCCLPSYPTNNQAQELCAATTKYIQKNGEATKIVQAISTAKNAQNKIQKCILVAHLLKLNKKGTKPESLVFGSEAAKYVIALFSGVDLDQLENEKYDLKKWASPPMYVRRAVFSILYRSTSWRMLLAPMLRDAGLWKYIAKSCHLFSFCKNKSTGRVALALIFLRGGLTKPNDQHALYDLERRGIKDALIHLAKDPEYDYSHDITNLSGELFIQDFLQGTESAPSVLHAPRRANLNALLAQRGNTAATWRRAIELGLVSARDYLANIRSMVFIDLPETPMIESLLALSEDELSLTELLKVRKILIGEFLVPGAKSIGAVRRARLDDTSENNEARLKLDTGALYKDKRGQLYQVQPVTRTVGPSFSEAIAKRYVAGIDTVLAHRINKIQIDANVSVFCRCLLSHELWINGPRRGIPPAIPKYSITSSWRNEVVDLASVTAAISNDEFASTDDAMDMSNDKSGKQKLLFGITWCEDKDHTNGRVDLDASVMIYDSNFVYLESCSYQRLSAANDSIIHSGDLTSAPYPDGARETVQIDLELLRIFKPEARYLVLVIHSFSGQSLDDLEDASAFVADPSRQGSGPGGTYVLCAARLSGKGAMNIAGLLDCGDADNTLAFSTIDHTCNVKNRNASSSSRMVGDHLKRLVLMAESPARLRLIDVSCFYAHALLRDGTLEYIGQEPLEPTEQNSTASVLDRFHHDQAQLTASRPVFHTRINLGHLFPSKISAERKAALIIFGGDLDNWLDLLRQAPDEWVSDPARRRLIFVNLRSDKKELTVKNLKVAGERRSITIISGWDILPIIIEHLQVFSVAMYDD